MATPLFIKKLEKVHQVDAIATQTSEHSLAARELQAYQSINTPEALAMYQQRKTYLESLVGGEHRFSIINGQVHEVQDLHQTLDVSLVIQVKDATITWFLWTPEGSDTIPQSFREAVFANLPNAPKAHLAMLGLQNHKQIILGTEITPEVFAEHLQDFLGHQKQAFTSADEVKALTELYSTWYQQAHVAKPSASSCNSSFFGKSVEQSSATLFKAKKAHDEGDGGPKPQ